MYLWAVANTSRFPPILRRVKLNTDGSVLNGIAGTGMVLQDHLGDIIFSSCRFLGEFEDVLETEIIALHEGISIDLQSRNLPIDVESNYLKAVAMVKSSESNLSKYSIIIREIKQAWRNVTLLLLIYIVVAIL